MAPHIVYFNTGVVAPVGEMTAGALANWVHILAKYGPDSPEVFRALIHGETSAFVDHGVISDTSPLRTSWDGIEKLFDRLALMIGVPRGNVMLSPSFLMSLRYALEVGRQLGFKKIFYTDLDNPVVVREIDEFCRDFNLTPTILRLKRILIESADRKCLCDAILDSLKREEPGCVLFSHIDYRFGSIVDVNKLISGVDGRHLLLVDVAHSIGQVPFEIKSKSPIIVLGTGHKWLGGSRSSAFLAVAGEGSANSELLRKLTEAANTAFAHIDQLINQTRGYEYSSICEIPLISLGMGLKKVLGTGIDEIQDRVFKLFQVLGDGLNLTWWKPVVAERRCGICFFVPRFPEFSAQEVSNKMRRRHKIAISAYDSEPAGIRVCVSYENTSADIEKLIDALSDCSVKTAS